MMRAGILVVCGWLVLVPGAYAQEVGKVYVKTDPPGAQVFVGGKMLGKTPTLVEMPVGNAVITLKQDGYRTTQMVVKVVKDDTVREELVLDKASSEVGEVKAQDQDTASAVPEKAAVPEQASAATAVPVASAATPMIKAPANGNEEMDPGELFPSVSWEKATSSVPMAEMAVVAQPKVAPELAKQYKAVQERIATAQKTQTVENEKKVEYKPISTKDDVGYYEQHYADKEKRVMGALRADPILDLVGEIRKDASSAADLPGRQRYMLMRSVIMVRKAKAPGSAKLQALRAENIKALSQALTPLLGEESAASLLARTQLVAGLSDVLIEQGRLLDQQAKQAKFDATHAAEEAKRLADQAETTKMKLDATNPTSSTAKQLAQTLETEKLRAEKARKQAEEAKKKADDAAEDAKVPNAESIKAMERGYEEFIRLAKWQLTHGYLEQAGSSLAEATRYANMLDDNMKRQVLTELTNEQNRRLRAREKYLQNLATQGASQPASQPASAGAK